MNSTCSKHAAQIPAECSIPDLAQQLLHRRYSTFAQFLRCLGAKLLSDSAADQGRGRYQLARALFEAGRYLIQADADLCFADPDFEEHPRTLVGYPKGWQPLLGETIPAYPGSFSDLATQLGDLRYDVLAEVLTELAKALTDLSIQVKAPPQHRSLDQAADEVGRAAGKIEWAWEISKPFMQPAPTA